MSNITEIIKNEIALRHESYSKNANAIVEHFGLENQNIEDYNGRQLLEMLQNADDACIPRGDKPKKAKILLTKNKLYIANNGEPFSEDGIISLMYSHMSSKTEIANKIGEKGLGFRSVLNWSKEIIIHSYDLHLRFSKDYAQQYLDELRANNPILKENLLKKQKRLKEDYPIAVLRCPQFLEDIPKYALSDYDTVIELHLKAGIAREVETQIAKDVTPEVLLFLNRLDTLEVETTTEHFTFSKYLGKKDEVIIRHIEEDKNSIWKVHTEKGIIEGKSKPKDGKLKTKNYELKLAFPKQVGKFNSILYSYFRTNITFPFPFLAHGSFVLSSNREQLVDDTEGFNKQLMEKLAQMIVQKATLQKTETVSWDAFLSITSSKDIPEQHGFKTAFLKALSNAQLFPTISDNYVSFEENPYYYPHDINAILPYELYEKFPFVLKVIPDKHRTDVEKLLRKLSGGILKMDAQMLNKGLNEVTKDLDKIERLEWIYLLTEHTSDFYLKNDIERPNLLLDNKKNVIEKGEDKISMPPEKVEYTLTEKVKIRFLQTGFVEQLRKRLSKENVRMTNAQLAEKLKPFGVEPYRFNTVIGAIVKEVENNLKKTSSINISELAEMHTALFLIFQKVNYELPEHEKEAYPFKNVKTPFLVTDLGNFERAENLYFGRSYDESKLVLGLFRGVREDIFLGSQKQNGLDDWLGDEEREEVIAYFKWIGVVDMPRPIEVQKNIRPQDDEYVKTTLKQLNYPYRTHQSHLHHFYRLEDFHRYNRFQYKLHFYDYFDEIIKNAPFEYILTWLLKDRTIRELIFENKETSSSELFYTYRSQNRFIRREDLISYLLFQLQRSKFIPVGDGEKRTPNECILTEDLAPFIYKPSDINYKAEIFKKNNIDANDINYLLLRLGVKENINSISLDDIYDFLLKHHNMKYFGDTEEYASKARALYRLVLEATRDRSINGNNRLKQYHENGKILVKKHGELSFESVKDAYYVQNPNHSQALMDSLYIAQIPRRRGNQRVLDTFNVKPLDEIILTVTCQDEEAYKKLNNELKEELEAIKPCFFFYRHGKNASQLSTEVNSLKRLEVRVSSDIQIKDEQGNSFELKDYEYIIDSTSEKAIRYIKLPLVSTNLKQLKRTPRFQETIADIVCGALKVTENQKDFMFLFGMKRTEWKPSLEREFNDFDDRKKIVDKHFKFMLGEKETFWKVFTTMCGVQLEDEDLKEALTIYEALKAKFLLAHTSSDKFHHWVNGEIVYSNFNASSNLPIFQKLFKAVNKDIKDFNSTAQAVLISFKDFFRLKVLEYHKEFSKKYASWLFENLKKQSINEQKNFLTSCKSVSDLERFAVADSLFVDIEKVHSEKLTQKVKNYKDICKTSSGIASNAYTKECEHLKNSVKNEASFSNDVFTRFIDGLDDETKSLIYFGKTTAILEDLKKRLAEEKAAPKSMVNVGDRSIDIDSGDFTGLDAHYQELVNGNKIYGEKIEDTTRVNVKTRSERKRNKNKGNRIPSSKATENIGFIGEYFAQKILKEQLKFDDVTWVSENAAKVNLPNGKAGRGYDFEVKRKGEEKRYIEVKSTVSDYSEFIISANEVDFGEKHPDTYDILFITNVKGDLSYKLLSNFFKYSEDEHLLENKRFTALSSNYTIKFK